MKNIGNTHKYINLILIYSHKINLKDKIKFMLLWKALDLFAN